MREKYKEMKEKYKEMTEKCQSVSAQELAPPSNFLGNRYSGTLCSKTPLTNMQLGDIWGQLEQRPKACKI